MSIFNGDDIGFNTFGEDISCLYYYYLNRSFGKDTSILGYASPIQTVCYNPFIETNDLTIVKSPFDVERYGQPNDTSAVPSVYRISENKTIEKSLMTKYVENNVSGEPVLNFFPYRYFMLYDGFNQPLVIKPQYLRKDSNGLRLEIKVRTNVNQNSKYVLFVNGYKNDVLGNLEGIVNDVPMLAPVSSSAYSQFWATSSAQFNQAFINTSIETQTSYRHNIHTSEMQRNHDNEMYNYNQIGSLVNGIGSLFSLNVGGVGSSIMSGFTNQANNQYMNRATDVKQEQLLEIRNNSEYYNEANRMATIQDFLKSPRAVSSLGTDMSFNKMKNNDGIILYEVTVEPSVLRKLEKFYHKYGYLLNAYSSDFKISSIRRNFNFVKMGHCDISGDRIPKEELEVMRAVFERGVTFWNVENNIEIADYSVSNEER